MTLHLIQHADSASLENCLRHAGAKDAVLFLQDGIYALVSGKNKLENFHGQLFALADDLADRGLTARCPEHVQPIAVDGFVELTESHSPCVSWR